MTSLYELQNMRENISFKLALFSLEQLVDHVWKYPTNNCPFSSRAGSLYLRLLTWLEYL